MPETGYRLTVQAGPHDRSECPIVFRLPDAANTSYGTLAGPNGARLAVQRLGHNEHVAVLPLLRAGQTAEFVLLPADPTRADAQSAVRLHDEQNGSLAVTLYDRLLTRYVYGDVPARPYFFPLHGPGNALITRGYPMLPDVEGEMRDHPHHRSLWIAHGDVNGADNWSEEPGHGFTRHKSIDSIVSGPVCGRFSATSAWQAADGAHLLTQRLQMTAWATGDSVRLIDIDIDLTADSGPVVFGDTKEGGILAVRVASSMDVPRGGRIENAYGGIDEAETWGRSAHWCDYSGLAGGEQVGIAVLDHPLSFRHPTTWHVRNYGLMTANPFGYAAFTNGVKDGTYTLCEGEILSYRYRIVLHSGDATQGNAKGHYLNYACPPGISLSSTNA